MVETAYISIGSNLSNPYQQVTQGLIELGLIEDTKVAGASSWYCSMPMGPKNQPSYINGVAKIVTRLNPNQLLMALQDIENKHARKRLTRWGPRTLDLDVAPKLILPDGSSLDSLLEICSPEGIVPLASGDIGEKVG
jgi:2-amino-4-hydroxy-6-hydroxymethyldihydropteridine diphosphokinase